LIILSFSTNIGKVVNKNSDTGGTGSVYGKVVKRLQI